MPAVTRCSGEENTGADAAQERPGVADQAPANAAMKNADVYPPPGPSSAAFHCAV